LASTPPRVSIWANVDRRDLEEIFMPIDPKRTGIVKVDEFESRLMAAQIVLPENTKTVLRTAYTSVGQTNYRKFIKDVILVYPLYADVLGINESQGPPPAVILHEVLRQIFDSHRNLSEYATTIDRGKKGYLNRGDVKTAFEAFKKTISISDQDFDTIYKIINPANDAKILYYKFDEQLTREMEPLLAEMSGRILNGFEVNKEPLGVKVAASGKVKKQWISIPDLITILRAYNEKLLENHIWQLINFLDIPLKDIDLDQVPGLHLYLFHRAGQDADKAIAHTAGILLFVDLSAGVGGRGSSGDERLSHLSPRPGVQLSHRQ
jgi:Ca2+-binding EF-hand superfamily protein